MGEKPKQITYKKCGLKAIPEQLVINTSNTAFTEVFLSSLLCFNIYICRYVCIYIELQIETILATCCEMDPWISENKADHSVKLIEKCRDIVPVLRENHN